MNVPDWSGTFTDLGGIGIMPIHVADTRHHRPPAGFRWIDAVVEDDAEVQIFERVDASRAVA